MIVPVSFTVKTGLTFNQAFRAVKELNERFETVKFYYTPSREKFSVRGIIKEIEAKPIEQRLVCEEIPCVS